MSDYRELGAQLKRLRKEAGYTQEQAADHLGLHRVTIIDLENGGRRPKDYYVSELLQFYGVDIDLAPNPAPQLAQIMIIRNVFEQRLIKTWREQGEVGVIRLMTDELDPPF